MNLKRLLLPFVLFLGVLLSGPETSATTCPNATALTAALPIINQALVCGTTNDITFANTVAICGSSNYYGGNEALYTYTSSTTKTVTISYNGGTTTSFVGIFVFAGCPTTTGTTCLGAVNAGSGYTTNLTVTLTAGVTYYFMFDTYAPPNSPCPGTFSITSCQTPTGLAAGSLGTNSASLSFTGTASGYQVEYGTSSTLGSATNTRATTTASPYVLFGLSQATTYYAWVRSICAAGDTSAWSARVNFTTTANCAAPTAVTVSNISGSFATISWTPPAILPFTGYRYEVRTGGAAGSGTTGLATSGTVASGTNSVSASGLSPTTAYNVYVKSDCATMGSSSWASGGSFTTTAACVPPSGLNVTGLSTTGATVNWTAPIQTPYQYYYEVRTSGAAGSGATGLIASGTVASGTNSLPVSSLTAGTTYSVYLRSDCTTSNAGTSVWSAAFNFSTLCNPITTFPFVDAFVTAGLPTCWAASAGTGAIQQWTGATTDATNGVAGPYASAAFVKLNVYNAQTANGPYILDSRSYTLSSPAKQLQYYYYLGTSGYKGTTGNAGSDPYPMVVLGTKNGGVTYDTLFTHNTLNSTFATSSAVSNWTLNSIVLPAGYSGQTVQFRIVSRSNYAFTAPCNQALDEFTVNDAPPCLPPTGVSATNITSTGFTANWAIPANVPSGGYNYEVRTSGAAGSGATGLAASSTTAGTSINVTGLPAATAYNLYVQSNCGPTVSGSSWTAVVGVTTLITCAPPTAVITTSITATGVTIGWTAPAAAPSGGYRYEVRISGVGGSGTAGLAASGSTAAGVTTAAATGLFPLITYTVYVQSDCGSSNYSVWVAGSTFNTLCTPVPIGISAAATNLCAGDSTTLLVTSTNTSYVYTWVPATAPASGASVRVAPSVTTKYIVTATDTALRAGMCSTTDSVTLTVNPLSVVALGNDTTICGGSSVTLNAGNAGAGYLWSTGATSQTITVSTSGTYSVRVTGVGGCMGRDTIVVNVGSQLAVSLGPDTTLCGGNTLTLNAGNTGAAYLWSTGATSQTIAVVSAGTYSVRVTGTGGCIGRDTLVVNTGTQPLVNLGADTSICAGNSVTLNAGNAGAAYLWSTGATTQTIAVGSTGSYSVRVTNAGGCVGRDTVNINVNATLSVNLGNDTSICAGSSLTLNAGNGGTYVWNTGAVSQTISVSVAGTYAVQVTNTSGCSGRDTIVITTSPVPIVNLGADTSICIGNSLSLNAGNAGATYLWNTGAVTQTIMASASGNYSVRVTNAGGCIGRDTLLVTLKPQPIVALGNDTGICAGSSVTLNAGNAGSSYLWNTGATTQTIVASTSGAYSVRVTNPGGCIGRDTVVLSVSPALTVNLGNDTGICVGNVLNLNAGNAGASYLWNTGATTQTITTSTAGNYAVRVTNTSGCIGRDTLIVSQKLQPVVALGNDTGFCAGNFVTLNAVNAGGSYLWNTGATTQTITTSTAGSYSVWVTNAGGCIGRDTIVLSVNPLPLVALGNDTSFCSGNGVMLSTGNAGGTYLWNTGAATQTIMASASGSYSVRVTNSNGCVGRDTINITVNPLPVVTLGPDLTFCIGNTATLDAGSTGSSYLWSTGATTQSIGASVSGSYSVRVTNANGCVGRDTLMLMVNPLPVVALGSDTAFCTGNMATLTAGNAGASYLWSTGATSQTVMVATSGSYSVRVTNTNGCVGRDTIGVTVNPLPVVNLGNDTSICTGNSLSLSAGNAGGTYLWNTGATGQSITAAAAGAYSVRVTNSNSCVGRDTLNLLLNPMPVVTLRNDTTFCLGNSIVLNAGNAGANYLWNTGATTQSISAAASGAYSVRVTNGNGCVGRDTVNLTVNSTPVVALGPDRNFCGGGSAILDAGNAGSNYLWSTGATSKTINVAGSGTFSVRVTNGFSCTGRDTINVTVRQKAVAGKIVITGQSPTFTFKSIDPQNDSLRGWIFGDGTSALNNAPGTIAHTFTQAGTYKVKFYAANSCGSDTATTIIVVTTLSLKNAVPEGAITLFPNPAANYFVVQNSSAQKMKSITVLNVLGAVVQQLKTDNGKEQHIAIDGLAAGSYLVRITLDNTTVVRRLQITK